MKSPRPHSMPMSDNAIPIEARSGLDPFTPAEMPEPPRPKGLGWISVVVSKVTGALAFATVKSSKPPVRASARALAS